MKRYTAVILLIAVFSSADTLILQPGPEGKDTDIKNEYPAQNFGDWVNLALGSYTAELQRRTLIEWGLSELPDEAEITSAVMELYCYNIYGQPIGEINFFRITSGWEEREVTWNNQPGYDPSGPAIADYPQVVEWVAFDLTEYVQGWYGGEYNNYGIMGVGTATGCIVQFWSSDYTEDQTLRPKLTIEYIPADAAVTPSSLGAVKAAYR